MADTFDFDAASLFGSGAVGEPGKRFFYVLAGRDDGWVRLWMEKEQLQALADGLEELLRDIAHSEESIPEDAPPQTEPPDTPMLGEFHVTRMAVGYDPARQSVVLTAHSAEGTGDPTLSCRLTREQAGATSKQASAVCAGGRPICPMCQQPIDPEGHLCPKQNGHRVSGL